MTHRRKSWKTNALILVVIWIVLMILSLTILSSVVTPFLKTLQTQNLVSLDWGGYSVASNVLYPQPMVVSVSGTWIVPAVSPSVTNTYSAAWVGVGGQSDSSLIQTGSEHDFVNGKASYTLWYEMLPDNAIPIRDVPIKPGDQIEASIILTDSTTNQWLIQIADLTTGQEFTLTVNYNSSRLTAEWIMERPTVNNQITVLADFGSITFSNASAQLGSDTGTITSFPNYKILMEDRQNTELVSISSLDRSGSSFTVEYG